MMLMGGPKKEITVISGKMEPDKGEDNSLMYKVMAADILKAIEAKDASMLANTLQAFYSMCDSEPETEEGE